MNLRRTIVLVTHDPEIAAVTPRRIEIRDGKIAGKVDLTLAGLDGRTQVVGAAPKAFGVAAIAPEL